jgi:hypothetical protein
MDMTRDIVDRLAVFCGQPVGLKRIALNMDQVEQYSPPPNPAKITDSRAAGYIAEHGGESWELDALEPTVLDGLIETEIKAHRDAAAWKKSEKKEAEEKEQLVKVAEQWDSIAENL